MTYDEAMEYKRNLDPEILAGEDFETSIVVVPADVNDFYQYIQHLPDRKLVDSDAKYYCSNGQYKVNRIKFNETPPAHSEV